MLCFYTYNIQCQRVCINMYYDYNIGVKRNGMMIELCSSQYYMTLFKTIHSICTRLYIPTPMTRSNLILILATMTGSWSSVVIFLHNVLMMMVI